VREFDLLVIGSGPAGQKAVMRPPLADAAGRRAAPGRRRPQDGAVPTGRQAEPAVEQATRLVWTRLEAAITTTLATTTLAELVAEARRRHTTHTVHHPFTFHI
jgi:hypothetical protein